MKLWFSGQKQSFIIFPIYFYSLFYFYSTFLHIILDYFAIGSIRMWITEPFTYVRFQWRECAHCLLFFSRSIEYWFWDIWLQISTNAIKWHLAIFLLAAAKQIDISHMHISYESVINVFLLISQIWKNEKNSKTGGSHCWKFRVSRNDTELQTRRYR